MSKNALPLVFLIFGPISWACAAAAQAQTFPGAPSGTADESPLTLAQVTALAVQASPALNAARQSVAQALARVGQAQAQRRFQITFNSTASLSNASVYQPPPNQETFGTLQNTLTIPLPLGKRPGLAVTQAQAQRSGGPIRLGSTDSGRAGGCLVL